MSSASVTTPSDIYYKSRRNLAFFAGLLLLDDFAGLKHDTDAISVLPFQFDNIDLISHALVAIFLYAIWQYWTSWYSQSPEVREFKVNSLDCYFLGAVCSLALSLYVFEPTLLNCLYIVPSFVTYFLVWKFVFTKGTLILEEEAKIEEETRQERLSDILSNKDWVLIFNPSRDDGFKEITFKQDGAIGKGKNQNEARWRSNFGLLEILNAKGDVFSRFRYDQDTGKFFHTNDDDTQSIKNQAIQTPKKYLWDLISEGRQLISDNPRDGQSHAKWDKDYKSWKARIISVAEIESSSLAKEIRKPDDIRPLPSTMFLMNKEHTEKAAYVYEVTQRVRDYLITNSDKK